MNAEYLSKLPDEISGIVAKLEAFAKGEIAVELAPEELRRQNLRFGHTVNLLRRGDKAIILLNEPEVTTQALVHEVLHLKRAWIDRAWDLAPNRQLRLDGRTLAAVEETCRAINETIEHAFWLIPEEKRLGIFEPRIWNSDSLANLEKSDQVMDGNARKCIGATEWLQAKHLATDENLQSRWEAKLKEWGCWDLAQGYEAALRKSFPDKRGMLLLIGKYLDVSHRLVEIWRYDFKTHSDEVRPLG